MAKGTHRGSAGPDHPIYSGGLEMFSHPGSTPSSAPSARSTFWVTPEKSSSASEYSDPSGVTRAEELEDGQRRIAKYLHRNPEKMREVLDKVRQTTG